MSAAGLLAGRIALVTGAGSGIGSAVCQVFAQEGARVAAMDKDEARTQQTISSLSTGEHYGFIGDVSSSQSVAQVMKDIQQKFSGVPAIAVNSAGITRDNFLLKMEEESFDEVIQVNLKAVAKAMTDNNIENGSIINIASIVGKTGNIGQCNYAAAKAGIEGLSRTAAKELSKFGIRVNAVLPGFINTPMTAAVPTKVIQAMTSLIPMRRIGNPEEVAEVCLFLASQKSSYITGVSIEVTGGLYM